VNAQHDAAIAQDPSVFDYDGVYDEMKDSLKEPKQAEKLERKSRYISTLLLKAKEREREADVRTQLLFLNIIHI
jgi:coiled-coil domain-containing protein 55